MLDRNAVQRRFDRAASGFDAAAFVHGATRDGLLARLEPLTIDAATVIDLGAATGATTHMLRKRFRGAMVISVDQSAAMLARASRRGSWLRPAVCVQAEALALPFADQSVDVVFANLLLPWISEPERLFLEIARVLRREGVFAFATLGPDSLSELRSAWRTVDERPHVLPFADMHDVGDALTRAGLRDPVLDVDRLTVSYRDVARLFTDLTAAGARNALLGRHPGLTGRGRFAAMRRALVGEDGGVELDLELVYGHCFGAGARPAPGDIRIEPGAIGRRRH